MKFNCKVTKKGQPPSLHQPPSLLRVVPPFQQKFWTPPSGQVTQFLEGPTPLLPFNKGGGQTMLLLASKGHSIFKTLSNIYGEADLQKQLTIVSRQLPLQKTPSQMFDSILNICLICINEKIFVVLRQILSQSRQSRHQNKHYEDYSNAFTAHFKRYLLPGFVKTKYNTPWITSRKSVLRRSMLHYV